MITSRYAHAQCGRAAERGPAAHRVQAHRTMRCQPAAAPSQPQLCQPAAALSLPQLADCRGCRHGQDCVCVAGRANQQTCSPFACATGHCREGKHDAERRHVGPPGNLRAVALLMYHVTEWGGHVAALVHGTLTNAEERERQSRGREGGEGGTSRARDL